MQDDLKNIIENLYQTFAVYPLKAVIDGCPCCVSDTDKEKLHTDELRQLDENNFSRYANKAMTTWGIQMISSIFCPGF